MTISDHTAITHRFVEIDAKIATEMLAEMFDGQRRVSDQHVDKLAQDMRNGKWSLSPDPIVRASSGKYINGQHRLRAVVRSGVSVTMLVSEGWPESTYQVMDCGKKRILMDRVSLPWMKRSNSVSAMVRMAATCPAVAYSRISEQTVVAVAVTYGDVFEFLADGVMRNKRITAPIGAAMARAIIAGMPQSTAQRFGEVFLSPSLSDGPHESAAVALYERLNGEGWSGERRRIDCYQIATRAVQLFAMGGTQKLLKTHTSDLFPRPNEMVEMVAIHSTTENEA